MFIFSFVCVVLFLFFFSLFVVVFLYYLVLRDVHFHISFLGFFLENIPPPPFPALAFFHFLEGSFPAVCRCTLPKAATGEDLKVLHQTHPTWDRGKTGKESFLQSQGVLHGETLLAFRVLSCATRAKAENTYIRPGPYPYTRALVLHRNISSATLISEMLLENKVIILSNLQSFSFSLALSSFCKQASEEVLVLSVS